MDSLSSISAISCSSIAYGVVWIFCCKMLFHFIIHCFSAYYMHNGEGINIYEARTDTIDYGLKHCFTIYDSNYLWWGLIKSPCAWECAKTVREMVRMLSYPLLGLWCYHFTFMVSSFLYIKCATTLGIGWSMFSSISYTIHRIEHRKISVIIFINLRISLI